MTTKIYPSYSAFCARDDKDENGVSAEFAASNPDYEKRNETNRGCYGCSGCSGCYDCSGCSDCSDCSGCYGCSDCSDCSGCSGCSGCSDCSGCYDCSGCSRCSDCSDCSRCSGCSGCYGCFRCSGCYDCYDKKETSGTIPKAPKIETIHTSILAAVEKPGALDMSTWHTCDTTHCRAGWVVTLAGKPGKQLEEATSTLFAAMQIYHASSPIKVSPVRYFEKNDQAMADMKRCADEEARVSASGVL